MSDPFGVLFTDSPIPEIVYDVRTLRILAANPAAGSLFQTEPPSLIGRPLTELVTPDARAFCADHFTNHTDSPVTAAEYPFQTAAGDPIPNQAIIYATQFDHQPARVLIINQQHSSGLAQDVTGQLELQRSLEDSERRLRAIFDNAPVGIIIAEANGHVLTANPAALAILGVHAQRLSVPLVADLHELLGPGNQQLLNHLTEDGHAPYEREHHFTHANGHTITALLRIVMIPGTGDIPPHLLATLTDTTLRKQATALWRATEERFEEIAHNINEVFWIVSSDFTRLEYANAAFERIWGLKAADVAGNPNAILDSIHPDDRQEVDQQIDRMRHGSPVEFRHRLTRPDGEERWLHTRATPVFVDFKLARFVGVSADVTAAVRADQEIRRSEERLRVILQDGTDAITLCDLNGNRTFVSPAINRLLGYQPEELIGKNLLSIVHPTDKTKLFDALVDVRGTAGATATVEYQVRHAGGAWHTFESTLHNLLEHPAVGAIVVHSRDITERKQVAARIVQMEDEIRNLALEDPVSGFRTRTGFLTFGAERHRMMQRSKFGLLMLLIQITNLAEINELQGPDAGDAAIADLSTVIKKSFRSADLLARLNGTTFALLIVVAGNAYEPTLIRTRFAEKLDAMNATRTIPIKVAIGEDSIPKDTIRPFPDLIRGAEANLDASRANLATGT